MPFKNDSNPSIAMSREGETLRETERERERERERSEKKSCKMCARGDTGDWLFAYQSV